jgi:flagellin-like protein
MKQRAISPIIATVILVAVTIALAVGVALWFSGIIGGAGSHEQLLILPDGNITNSTQGSAVYIHIKNSGSVDAQIISIKVGNMTAPLTGSNVATTFNTANNYIIVPAGKDGWININFTNYPFIPGTSYKVTIVTAAGNSYIQELQAVQGTS